MIPPSRQGVDPGMRSFGQDLSTRGVTAQANASPLLEVNENVESITDTRNEELPSDSEHSIERSEPDEVVEFSEDPINESSVTDESSSAIDPEDLDGQSVTLDKKGKIIVRPEGPSMGAVTEAHVDPPIDPAHVAHDTPRVDEPSSAVSSSKFEGQTVSLNENGEFVVAPEAVKVDSDLDVGVETAADPAPVVAEAAPTEIPPVSEPVSLEEQFLGFDEAGKFGRSCSKF